MFTINVSDHSINSFCLFLDNRGSACSSEMIVQKKKSARESQVEPTQITYQNKNVLGPGSSNESLGNPAQTIGRRYCRNRILSKTDYIF